MLAKRGDGYYLFLFVVREAYVSNFSQSPPDVAVSHANSSFSERPRHQQKQSAVYWAPFQFVGVCRLRRRTVICHRTQTNEFFRHRLSDWLPQKVRHTPERSRNAIPGSSWHRNQTLIQRLAKFRRRPKIIFFTTDCSVELQKILNLRSAHVFPITTEVLIWYCYIISFYSSIFSAKC